MAKYLGDLVDYLFEQQQEGFSAIDTTALDDLILEFIETPENGYMTHTEDEWDDDSTSYITVIVDSTSASITVLEWKELYLEDIYRQSFVQNSQIAISDHNSPNYPLINFRSILFDFDSDTSMDYNITPDTTSDLYIEYEYPIAEKVDGMFLQGGEDGAQTYDSTANVTMLAYYIGYSNDSQVWDYIKCDSTAINAVTGVITSNKDDAVNNPFVYSQELPITADDVHNITFPEAVEANYWRVYVIDLDTALTRLGMDSGYTGYTASLAHIRFQQFKTDGGNIVVGSVDGESIADRSLCGNHIGLGCIEEENLADFAIGTVKILDGAVTPAKLGTITGYYNGSKTIALPGTARWYYSSTFSIVNDDGLSGITVFFDLWAVGSSDPTDFFKLQIRNTSGTYVTVGSTFHYYADTNEAYYTYVYNEALRDDGDSTRLFRIAAYRGGAGSTLTLNRIRAMAIFTGS